MRRHKQRRRTCRLCRWTTAAGLIGREASRWTDGQINSHPSTDSSLEAFILKLSEPHTIYSAIYFYLQYLGKKLLYVKNFASH